MIDLGDTLEVIAIYHDKPNSGVPHPESPGVVKDKDGNIYVLKIIKDSPSPDTGSV